MSAEMDKENYRSEQNKENVAEQILDHLHEQKAQFPKNIQSHDKQLDLCEKELEKHKFNKRVVEKQLLERFAAKEHETSKRGKSPAKEEEGSKSGKGSPKLGESTHHERKGSPKKEEEKEGVSKKGKSSPMEVETKEEGEIQEDSKQEGKQEESEQSAPEEEDEGSVSKGKGRGKAKGRGRAKGRGAAAKGGKRGQKRKAAPAASPTKPGEVDTAGRTRRQKVWKTEVVANEANRAIVEEMNDLSKRYYKEGDTGRGGKYAYASKVFRHTHHPISKNEDTSKIYGIGTHIDKDVHEVQKEGESHRLEELEEST